jgi:hypothetical protein
MSNKEKVSEFYEELDRLLQELISMLNIFGKSQVLQDYFFDRFESLVYSNLINNFFKNLTKENIEDLNLPHDKISGIRREYNILQKRVKSTLQFSSAEKMTERDYFDFKSDLKRKFPDFLKLIAELEKLISIDRIRHYLTKKRKQIIKSGKPQEDLETIIITKTVEAYVNKNQKLPSGFRFGKSITSIAIKSLLKLSEEMMSRLEKDKPRMLKEHEKIRKGFESRLQKTWKEPFGLLESLIVVCLESGESKKDKLSKGKDITSPKQVALIKIHARAVQIAYEILSLVRSGFADGAHARWRSLHELAIITFFLWENSDDVSERYLNHTVMKKFKEAKNYARYYKKLKYSPPSKKEFSLLKREHDKLLQKYGQEFEYRSGFEWIPKSILADRSFRSLQEHVKMDKFHPFYSWASDSMHGGAKGLHRLGLMDTLQDEVLLVGGTNYGFADPIQNTAISLAHITSNLLLLEPDFEDFIILYTTQKYIKHIGEKAVETQKRVEKEHEQYMKSLFHKIRRLGNPINKN